MSLSQTQHTGFFTDSTDAPTAGLNLADYDYPLPEERIARYPLEHRDASRMMLVSRQKGMVSHRQFTDFPDLLNAGDLIVVNNTRVLQARLLGNRRGFTGQIEVLLLQPDEKTSPDEMIWLSMTRPTKRLSVGTIIELPGTNATVEVVELSAGVKTRVKIHLADEPSVAALMEKVGHIPIPPYLKRPDEAQDKITYQTVYAKNPGSLAAPTAGLHFTPAVLDRLKQKGVNLAEVTLTVSTGTFRTVDAEDIRHHQMDAEHYQMDQETVELIQKTKAAGGRVIAIGTTSAKTIETVADRFMLDDSAGYQSLQPAEGWSQLFIYPGFQFKVVDALLTNFHLPKSTLLMLVSAFANRKLMGQAYQEALKEQYRFFSYGDCMLIE